MSAQPEQLCRWDNARTRRTEKRRASRYDRRKAKQDPENAPRRRAYRGWSY